jgi:hypothetical protein
MVSGRFRNSQWPGLKNEEILSSGKSLRRLLMWKILVVATVAAIPLMLSTGEVRASGMSASRLTGVTCPAGTCGNHGASNAKELKFCKASKCAK